MTPNTYQTIPVTCPNCQHRFVTPVLTLIDAGTNPEAKALFLSGQINIAACPQCGHAGMLSVPLVYHDAGKELLFTFVPQELKVSEAEQQRLVGQMTNQLISSLPPEQRKGYLLRPRSFYRLQGMIEAILEADGITREVLEKQKARSDLLDRLLHTPGEGARRIVAEENDAQIDYEFFQLLALNIELAQAAGQSDVAQQLLELRNELLGWTKQGQEIAAREQAIESLGEQVTRERLLEQLVEAAMARQDVKVETMVAVARPAIDYVFYQQLAGRIEAAEQAGKVKEAAALRSLRETVLDLTAEIDAEVQQATEEAGRFLQTLLQSDDPEAEIRSHPDWVDDLFVGVLGASLQAAERSGPSDTLERLRRIRDVVMQLVQESQPAEIRLINELLTSEYPAETQGLLERQRDLVDGRLLEVMDQLGQDLADRGRKEMAQRLALIREQAAAMVDESRR